MLLRMSLANLDLNDTFMTVLSELLPLSSVQSQRVVSVCLDSPPEPENSKPIIFKQYTADGTSQIVEIGHSVQSTTHTGSFTTSLHLKFIPICGQLHLCP